MKHSHLVCILFGVIVIQFLTGLWLIANPIVEVRYKPVYLIMEHESDQHPSIVTRAI